MPRLVFIGGHFAGQTVELDTGRTMVGRGHWNGLVIADKTVSNYHCDLLVHGREVIVREKGSTNGTWVDDQRVTGQLPVKPGQIVHFGSACA
jgi:pSer/pThr/pTyr-binding forkhead associated (FHA) protein